jgi:hypothetical protein
VRNASRAPARARPRARVAANFGNFRTKADARRAGSQARRSGGSRGLGRTYFFLAVLLLLDRDLVALVFEVDALFLEPLELPDLVGINTLPFRRAQPLNGNNGSNTCA